VQTNADNNRQYTAKSCKQKNSKNTQRNVTRFTALKLLVRSQEWYLVRKNTTSVIPKGFPGYVPRTAGKRSRQKDHASECKVPSHCSQTYLLAYLLQYVVKWPQQSRFPW